VKLRELGIKNFRCIGSEEISIKVDNIIVLIGANNVGKSTVIAAYQAFSGTGGALKLDDFHNYETQDSISITGIFSDVSEEDKSKIGEKWIFDHDIYGESIKYKWEWNQPDKKGNKYSWNPSQSVWEDGGMGGWDSKISSCVPEPLIISPLESASSLESKIIEILTNAIKSNIKDDTGKMETLIDEFEKIAKEAKLEMASTLEKTTNLLQNNLQNIFPGHEVQIQPRAGKFEPEKIIASGSNICITEPPGNTIPLDKQGTGLQRAFLWSAVGALSDSDQYKVGKKAVGSGVPRILIIEEPETFLHPPAIRAAREALYKISELENWQVLITTHSPVFIDVSKPHTTIIRMSKIPNGITNTFSTDMLNFDEDDRKRLQMIRNCHPTVNEFFFSEKIILVEGDTEVALFSEILIKKGLQERYQIVNCLGKANIPMFQKILNHFGLSYIVIHDVDSPKVKGKKGYKVNAMWTINSSIFDEAREGCHIIAHMPNLEAEYFDALPARDKPYNAINKLADSEFQKTDKYKQLMEIFDMIENNSHPMLITDVNQYQERVEAYKEVNELTDDQKWDIE